jgi:hypothetical protein
MVVVGHRCHVVNMFGPMVVLGCRHCVFNTQKNELKQVISNYSTMSKHRNCYDFKQLSNRRQSRLKRLLIHS